MDRSTQAPKRDGRREMRRRALRIAAQAGLTVFAVTMLGVYFTGLEILYGPPSPW